MVTCRELQVYRVEHCDTLIADIGDEEYDIQIQRTENMLTGIREGLLMRSLFTAVAG